MEDLGIIKKLLKRIPKLTFPCPIFMMTKSNCRVCHTTVTAEDVPIYTCIQFDSILFNVASIIWFTSAFNVINATSR